MAKRNNDFLQKATDLPKPKSKPKKKKSSVQQEYNKQRRRVQKNITKLESEGYSFYKNPLPKIPKKITQASVNRMKKITSKSLKDSSYYTTLDSEKLPTKGNTKRINEDRKKRDTIKNDIKEAMQKDKVERERRYKELDRQRKEEEEREKNKYQETANTEYEPIGDYAAVALANFKAEIASYPIRIATLGYKVLYELQNEVGDEVVAQAIVDMGVRFHDIVEHAKFDSDSLARLLQEKLLFHIRPYVPPEAYDELESAFDEEEGGYDI